MRSARSIFVVVLTGVLLGATGVNAAPPPPTESDPFAAFDLPAAWKQRFWEGPDAKALRALDLKAVAALVPVQAGIRFCRCPACDATEADDPLAWSVTKPKVLTCKKCGVVVPNDDFPAKVEKKVPEDDVEVVPKVVHHYPYHAVAPEKQRYPDERLYLDAKRDHEAREFLAKAALYAAVRQHEDGPGASSAALARLACVLILRFAQVYPTYALHDDQPGGPKFFEPANLPPPYRRGYRTGKWDWSASVDVPLNLVLAYALTRRSPALAEAGRLLGDPNPARTIEQDLFRASADFVSAQPEEYNESSLRAYRGLLAVGRLLNDPGLVRTTRLRLDGFAERGFYHDGFWRQGDALTHRQVLNLLDAWINPLLPAGGAAEAPMLALARAADSALVTDPQAPPEVKQASWPVPATMTTARIAARRPLLLGGAGLARLAVGDGADALDLELRGQDSLAAPHYQRLALRLALGGRPVLGDLDERPPLPTGWDRATASHNTVVVDGLNQRESLAQARRPVAGGEFLFYAADPDFQVATLDDPRAYPQSTTRYRQTLIASRGPRTRYAVSVFEVHGGLRHEQLYHAAAGSPARWQLSVPMNDGPTTLLPPSIVYVPTARAEDGRWFVQFYGELTPLGQARLNRPVQAALASGPGTRGARLHLLGDMPTVAITALGPDPTLATPRPDTGRATLILRRDSENGSTLKSTFVTLFEPISSAPVLIRVGRVASDEGTVVLYLETADGPEHLVVNLAPGTSRTVTLGDGQALTTDGLAVRVRASALVLAGGTVAESSGRKVRHDHAAGRITRAVRAPSAQGRGWFETDQPLPDPDRLAGRTIHVRHADGEARAWTLRKVENTATGALLFVVEEPGFTLDSAGGEARYYQFPRTSAPAPHQFHVSRISRGPESIPSATPKISRPP